MATKRNAKNKLFLQRLKDAKANGITLIVIKEPQELGDTYQEVMDSLNRLAANDLNLAILPEDARMSTN